MVRGLVGVLVPRVVLLVSDIPGWLGRFYGRLSLVEFLLEHSADMNRRDRYGFTPLFRAVQGAERRERNVEVPLPATQSCHRFSIFAIYEFGGRV